MVRLTTMDLATSQETVAGRATAIACSTGGMDTLGHSTPDSTKVGKMREMPAYEAESFMLTVPKLSKFDEEVKMLLPSSAKLVIKLWVDP